MEEVVPELPAALRRVLIEVGDVGLQDRLEQVFGAAARAITHLRDLDLTQYERDSADDESNLELLEQVAPILASTVIDVNALVTAVDQNFPKGAVFSEGGPVEHDKARRAVDILRLRSGALRADVLQLGVQLRSPRAVADRWNFLNHLQTARGRLRAGMGEMVADAASIYAEVRRADVIPEYQSDIDNAVGLRRTLHRLAVGLRSHLQRIEAGRALPLDQLFKGLSETMETLARTRTWRELRAPDKKEFVRFRARLLELLGEGPPRGPALEALKGFVSYLELLAAILNQRDTLRTHDQGVLAELTAQLERIEGFSAAKRPAEMPVVLGLCDRLVGRDVELDRFAGSIKASPTGTGDQIQILREHAQRLVLAR